MIEDRIKKAVRDVLDFPKKGIIFKDITPILKDQELCNDIVSHIVVQLEGLKIDAIAGIESRGFLFGMMLANRLNKPFIPIRKEGKLPFNTIKQSYNFEYGTAAIEIHQDAFKTGDKILIHDDLLATGGTVEAASTLIQKMGGTVIGYSFIISLDFLKGREFLSQWTDKQFILASYK